jgi:hypothetical protein
MIAPFPLCAESERSAILRRRVAVGHKRSSRAAYEIPALFAPWWRCFQSHVECGASAPSDFRSNRGARFLALAFIPTEVGLCLGRLLGKMHPPH